MRTRSGFTIIEMLTVIAIMAVLAAIIYPIYMSVKEKTKQGACMTNLHNICTAVKLYARDNRSYPDHLLYQGTDENGNTTMAGLYPGYVRDFASYTCPLSTYKLQTAVTVPGSAEQIYQFSSYDIGNVNGTWEMHYQLDRGRPQTDPEYKRQLLNSDAPEDTVLTWCTFHRKAPAFAVDPKANDIVIWLDGRAKLKPSATPDVQGFVRF